jgi:hypothetical protein
MVADKHHEGCFKNHLLKTGSALIIGKTFGYIIFFPRIFNDLHPGISIAKKLLSKFPAKAPEPARMPTISTVSPFRKETRRHASRPASRHHH